MIHSQGGVDLQLLGLGHNGHIGFNEPSDTFVKDVHLVDLTERTIEANKRFLPLQTMCLSRHTQWESEPFSRQKQFSLW